MTDATLDLVLATDDHDDVDSIAAMAREAEDRGFARVSAGETTGRDVVSTFAVVGERTREIGISTDVLSPYARAPTVLGQTALTLQEATGGRFRLGDGWVPQLFTPDGLRDRMADLARGADLGDRSVEELRVAPLVRCCAHENGEYARGLARGTVAFLIGAYGPFYGNSVAEQGYEEVVESIRAAWDDGDTGAMADRLPDELLDELAAAGTPAAVHERVERFQTIEGVDAVRIGFVRGMSEDDKLSTLDALEDLA
jgi:alkanesulfonate monooxygenase SsuD/methylene tetrahydromethanopterin reductase-like flavin-dependent oxidoreductase (luciferase family)